MDRKPGQILATKLEENQRSRKVVMATSNLETTAGCWCSPGEAFPLQTSGDRGEDCPEPAGVQEAAEATLRCRRRSVPPAVSGIAFLSGGQPEVLATQHLNRMNQIGVASWQLSFSYG